MVEQIHNEASAAGAPATPAIAAAAPALAVQGLGKRVRLPGGELLEYGPADATQSVRGSAHDFALLVTQRCHRADTDLVAEGPDADRWLDIAQSFAGPSGSGRAPKGSS